MISSEVVLLASATPVLSPRLVSRSHDGNLPVAVTVNVYIRVRVKDIVYSARCISRLCTHAQSSQKLKSEFYPGQVGGARNNAN